MMYEVRQKSSQPKTILERAHQYLASNPRGQYLLRQARNSSEVIEMFQEQLLARKVPDVEQNLRMSLRRGA